MDTNGPSAPYANLAPGAICFSDPDAVIAIDTGDNQAGFGLWSREDLARHHLLRPD